MKKKKYYDCLDRVGTKKPLGYLPLCTIRKFNHQDPYALLFLARLKGLYAQIWTQRQCHVYSGALVISDLVALRTMLEKNENILRDAHWPTSPVLFIWETFQSTAPQKSPLFDLIADTYADLTNTGRTDVCE